MSNEDDRDERITMPELPRGDDQAHAAPPNPPPPPAMSLPANDSEPVPVPARIPIRTASSDNRSNTVRIGLWGSPRSGKTTVLSALPIAAMQASNGTSNWNISGIGEQATRLLTAGVATLASQRRFPPATESLQPIMWSFQGQDATLAEPAQRKILRRRSSAKPETIDFALELQDVKGEWHRNDNVDPRVAENLAASQGIVYLFDPVYDRSSEDLKSFNFFFSVLQMVMSRVRDEGRVVEGRLPHHVAVLVTKFDDPAFFEHAVQAGWVNQENTHSQMPYVPLTQGQAFFDWVCAERQGGTATLVRDALNSFFHPERIEYFASSAVGFRLNANGVFDYNDYANVDINGGVPQIRSAVRPLNILEPVVRLERRIRRDATT
jgi:hypothetical protein